MKFLSSSEKGIRSIGTFTLLFSRIVKFLYFCRLLWLCLPSADTPPVALRHHREEVQSVPSFHRLQ